MSAPQSTIYICSGVRLDSRYDHSIYFESETAQQEYFAGKVVKTFSAYSYLRKTWPLQVSATMEQAKEWSYLFFRNGTGKIYYYFINQIEYKNDSMVELSLELDVLQTYLFDFQLLDCFVERQHTATDQIGGNVVDEGLELGEVQTISTEHINLSTMAILIMSTIDIARSTSEDLEEPVKVLGSYYDGIFNGVWISAVNVSSWQGLADVLNLIDKNGFSDGIISMWMYPKKLIKYDPEYNEEYLIRPVAGIEPFFQDTARPGTLADSYTPKNKKLLSYPYSFLYVTNNSGGSAIFHWERFGDPTACNFKITGAMSPEGQVRMYPLNYNGEQHAYENGLTLGNFPTCAWNQDVYKLWLAQNQNQDNLSMALAGLSVIGGVTAAIATGGAGGVLGLGGAISGAATIANILAQRKDQQLQPPQSRGSVSSPVNTVAGFQTFTLKKKSVSAKTARIIDDYFTMYGYKINRVQKPDLCTRPAFTYVKTVGCHIQGGMCTEDTVKIESIFDNGITFWVNGDKIADYSQNNTV